MSPIENLAARRRRRLSLIALSNSSEFDSDFEEHAFETEAVPDSEPERIEPQPVLPDAEHLLELSRRHRTVADSYERLAAATADPNEDFARLRLLQAEIGMRTDRLVEAARSCKQPPTQPR
ncbi:hypothetical protein [Stratiformator vulcanicus]|uniref:Uncharacterized protein n=1 Tax=Stratiformator vulcanicus TaxID=2527980 RepID=A0A517R1C1_9PLAN|nr:hypothetical protein [Stratiformator vulcanicus]QDT37634.1 hypothetical protein Pan189_20140 [Stratiformator vulcanicus]